jgi:hypothetical protein
VAGGNLPPARHSHTACCLAGQCLVGDVGWLEMTHHMEAACGAACRVARPCPDMTGVRHTCCFSRVVWQSHLPGTRLAQDEQTTGVPLTCLCASCMSCLCPTCRFCTVAAGIKGPWTMCGSSTQVTRKHVIKHVTCAPCSQPTGPCLEAQGAIHLAATWHRGNLRLTTLRICRPQGLCARAMQACQDCG